MGRFTLGSLALGSAALAAAVVAAANSPAFVAAMPRGGGGAAAGAAPPRPLLRGAAPWEAASAAAARAGPSRTACGAALAAVALACAGVLAGKRGAAARCLRSAPAPRIHKVARAADEEGEAASGDWSGAMKFSALTEAVPLVLDNVAVSKILPHRYPFLLVDKVVEFEAGKRAVGVKNVTANEPQFTGHFPDRPIMPGVLMVEAMAQLGGVVCLQDPVSDGKGEFFFAGIDGIKFRRPVVPGDTLVMEMELKKWRPKYGIAKMTGKAFVDGQLALEVKEFTFALVKEKKEES